MAALIDPTVAGKYPVILGDSLVGGKTSNEIFTGIRYNHKPVLSSSQAPDRARLKPSVPGKTSSYDLAYTDGSDSYAFAGPRSTDDDQYVLYFDPGREAFILDKVDSTFNMNVTRMPGNSDVDELSRRFPHLDTDPARDSINVKGPIQKSKPALASKTPGGAQTKRKADKKPPKNLALPASAPETVAPASTKPKPKKRQDDEDDDDEDEDDDDGGLLIEYPDAPPPAVKQNDFSPAFPTQRRFDDYMNQRESEADDADGESDDEIDMGFKLPSPVNKQQSPEAEAEQPGEDENADDGGTVDLEGDLENALEIAFEDLANSQEEGRDDESEISEED